MERCTSEYHQNCFFANATNEFNQQEDARRALLESRRKSLDKEVRQMQLKQIEEKGKILIPSELP